MEEEEHPLSGPKALLTTWPPQLLGSKPPTLLPLGLASRMMLPPGSLIPHKISQWRRLWRQTRLHFTTVHSTVHITPSLITKAGITTTIVTYKAQSTSSLAVADLSSIVVRSL